MKKVGWTILLLLGGWNGGTQGEEDLAHRIEQTTAQEKNFLCAITRMRDEHQLLKSFVQHHRWEGVDKIVVIEDTNARHPYQNHDADVQVIPMNLSEYTAGTQWQPLDEVSRSQHMKGCEWIASLDVDEFLSTRRNPCKTVAQELKDSFESVDAVNVPWIMFSYNEELEVVNDVRHDNIMRWNHSERHSAPLRVRKYKDLYYNDETKPIFRPERLKSLKIHGVILYEGKYVDGVAGVENIRTEPFKFVNEFHEPDIANALLVINHYRFTCLQNVIEKCTLRNINSEWQADYAIETDTCIAAANASNWREVRDESMRYKYLWRSQGIPCVYEDPGKYVGVVMEEPSGPADPGPRTQESVPHGQAGAQMICPIPTAG